MKFTEVDLKEAIEDLATLKYFPHDSKSSVMRQMAAMCPGKKELRFVVDTVLARCSEWPGMGELRGLLCSRYDAADGIDQPICNIPGFSASEQEAKYLARHEQLKALEHAPGPLAAILTEGNKLQ